MAVAVPDVAAEAATATITGRRSGPMIQRQPVADTIGLNHVAITMGADELAENLDDVLSFYGKLFGWTGSRQVDEPGQPLLLHLGAAPAALYIYTDDEPTGSRPMDHFGVHVGSEAEVDAVVQHARSCRTRNPEWRSSTSPRSERATWTSSTATCGSSCRSWLRCSTFVRTQTVDTPGPSLALVPTAVAEVFTVTGDTELPLVSIRQGPEVLAGTFEHHATTLVSGWHYHDLFPRVTEDPFGHLGVEEDVVVAVRERLDPFPRVISCSEFVRPKKVCRGCQSSTMICSSAP